ncbi:MULTISPECIES: major capsid protein [Lapidilactobacillus]|uniref:Major capsid protein n=2 Tax=Lapidilactobacillus TaxID=2767884 RepID=A0ABW1UQD0_9LACO|nr:MULTISPECIES: major capsid protein [Lapidilactobacillus]
MPTIYDLFTQADLIDYSANRQYKPFLGDSLFPAKRVETLKVEQLSRGSKIPILASVAAFNSEAEIGSRTASKTALELALIKRKYKIDEEDIIAMRNPRTPQEAAYLKDKVFNDFDVLNQGILGRIEQQTMEMFSTGKIHLRDDDSDTTAVIDYQIPEKHQQALTDTAWDKDGADPIKDLENWCDALDITPTRALTSKKIYRLFTQNPKVIAAIWGKDSGRLVTQAALDEFMQSAGLPVIRTYDAKYNIQLPNGKYASHRYYPEDRITLFNDDLQGNKLFGPNPDEAENMDGVKVSKVGNIFNTVFTETHDPVATFEKASAVALPSFAAADEVFLAQPIAGVAK